LFGLKTWRLQKPRTLAAILFVFALGALLTMTPQARADAGVVLNESLDTSVARITGSGHSAVYLSRICPAGSLPRRRVSPKPMPIIWSCEIFRFGSFGETVLG